MSVAFSIKSLSKTYEMGEEKVVALDAVDLEVPEGDYVAIMGPSGSGKSTLLNLLGCLDSPTGGSYRLKGEEVTGLTDEQLSEVRCRSIGFVFQSYNLIPYLDVLDNVRMPRAYAPGKIVFGDDVRHLVELVGLKDRANHKPQQLSGGQQQRVGIARSLSNDPDFILADEPTGNLDSKTTHEVLNLLDELNSRGKTIVMVTHEMEVAARARRVIVMKDGQIEKEECARPLCEPSANTGASAREAIGKGDGFGKKAKRVWRNLGKAALLSIVTHPMRSFLTAIGVFIGVASVIWLLAIGEGLRPKRKARSWLWGQTT